MTSSRIHNRVLAFAALVLAGILSLAAMPAWAHDELLGADPADGAHLDALPAEIALTFSGVLLDEPGATDIVVTDAAGTDLTDGDPVLDGTRVRQALQGAGSGPVTVLWRVVSSDGHPISGQYAFTVGEGGATFTPAPGADMAGTDATWLLWVGGIAVVCVVGIVLVVVLSRKRAPRED
ncbi:copper resistance CopC family protein [Microbacterium sp.]|uniref:copper resistance CopC family protein n=1 Tax=Microbacterium sp. TaxID=51671 RepID=UPI0039E44346